MQYNGRMQEQRACNRDTSLIKPWLEWLAATLYIHIYIHMFCYQNHTDCDITYE